MIQIKVLVSGARTVNTPYFSPAREFIEIIFNTQLLTRQEGPPVPSDVALGAGADNFRRKYLIANPVERPSATELRQPPYLVLCLDYCRIQVNLRYWVCCSLDPFRVQKDVGRRFDAIGLSVHHFH